MVAEEIEVALGQVSISPQSQFSECGVVCLITQDVREILSEYSRARSIEIVGEVAYLAGKPIAKATRDPWGEGAHQSIGAIEEQLAHCKSAFVGHIRLNMNH
jgi:hypothetical protein